jgi:predicted  nucleic acid-binding Zn-ribbon protein
MNGPHALLQVQEIDLLLQEVGDPAIRARLERLGFALSEDRTLLRHRSRMFAGVDRRWQRLYERAQLRYGRGVVGVRERVCQGCRIQLPTSAAPGPGESLTLCESCGRILYWG